MSKLIIRKRLSLDFLGEEYAEAYLVFKAIAVGDYDKLMEQIKSADANKDTSGANATILNILKDYYLEGMFPNEKGELEKLDGKEELDGLPPDALIECFGKITGQDLKGAMDEAAANPEGQVAIDVDPKSDGESKPGSMAESQPPTK